MTKQEVTDLVNKYSLATGEDSELIKLYICDAINWFQNDYLIIPKESVRMKYKSFKDDLIKFEGSGENFARITKTVLAIYEDIFGKELFKDLL